MAITIPRFQQIRPGSYVGASQILNSAGRQFDRGFDALDNVMGDLRKRSDARINTETQENDQTIAANLEKFTNLRDVQKAEDSGAFNDSTMFNQFGNRYSKDALKSNITALKTKLKNKAVSEAATAGRAVAEDTQDISKGLKTFTQSLIDQGVKTDVALKATSEFSKDAEPLRQLIQANKKAQYNDAMGQLQTAGKEGKDMITSLADIGKSLQPEQRRKFQKEGREYINTVSSLTPEQRAEIGYQTEQNNNLINTEIQKGQSIVAAAEQRLSEIPKPISEEVSAHFADVADAGGSVIDWFRPKLESTFGQTEGALKKISDKYQNMLGSGVILPDGKKVALSDREVAAFLVESYQATYGDQHSWIGTDLDMDALDAEINRRVQLHVLRTKEENQLQTVKSQINNHINQMKEKSTTQLFELGKGLRKGNRTGQQPNDNLKRLKQIGTQTKKKRTPEDLIKKVVGEVVSTKSPTIIYARTKEEEEASRKQLHSLLGKNSLQKLLKDPEKNQTIDPVQNRKKINWLKERRNK